MKPTQSPSIRQIITYDILSQNLGCYSLILGIVSLGFITYGLLNKALNIAALGGMFSVFLIWFGGRLVWRYRFFQKVFENGETVRLTIDFIGKSGDNINLNGEYRYKGKNHRYSTTLQKTGRSKNLAVGDQLWLVVDLNHPKNAYIQDLFTPDSAEEIRQPFVPDVMEDVQQIIIPENAAGWDGIHQRKISWEYESGDDTFGDTKENPSESEIVKLIRDVYAQEANYGILEINKEQNLFMQIGFGGAPLEFCVGPDGPIYGVNAVPVEIAIKCFLSYNAGDEFWKTALPWKVHIKSIKDANGRK